ncbi:GyrI-like domain-containing protein [Rhodococcus sp. NPDC055112]
MSKLDFKKQKELYSPAADDFVLVEVPPMWFLMIDGHGDPNVSEDYRLAVEALYAASYAVKFASKKGREADYVVGPLEGRWWAPDPAVFVDRSKSEWNWTMQIRQPDWMTAEEVAAILAETESKKKLPVVGELRHERHDEGLSAQIMHVGSYDDEAPTLERLHDEFIPGRGLEFNGKHHEIYLGDPRKSAPEKLRTVLRQPVRQVSATGATRA